MTTPLTLGVAGLGTVGTGLVELLDQHSDRLANLTGRPIRIGAVSARSRHKDRGVDVSRFQWFGDPVALARDPSIDCFVELMGGDEGAPYDAVVAALQAGKPVVTANKALLAKHGVALAGLAEKAGVALNFEAAVAGGIPVIKALRESLVPNAVARVYGILNGTCNYILTTMQEEGRAFADVLAEAQAKGYAEADPTFDIGGFDTAHKLSILTTLAFGTKLAFDRIDVEGIETITKADIEAADELGYRIKLLGVALKTPSGAIEARVHPTLVAKHSAVAEVSGVTNCVAIDGDYTGSVLLVGPGAGAHPTAAAVAGDVVDVARGLVVAPFGTRSSDLAEHVRAGLDAHQGAYYVRLHVYDKPGAMAVIAKHLGDRGVSLESIVQRTERKPGEAGRGAAGTAAPATVIIVTHETTEESIRAALKAIEADGKVSERPQLIRIERL